MKSVDWAELAQGGVQGQVLVYPYTLSVLGNGQNTQAANLLALTHALLVT
jgi:hypothetical protein